MAEFWSIVCPKCGHTQLIDFDKGGMIKFLGLPPSYWEELKSSLDEKDPTALKLLVKNNIELGQVIEAGKEKIKAAEKTLRKAESRGVRYKDALYRIETIVEDLEIA